MHLNVLYVFNLGQEYPAVVEFAPFQKVSKKKLKKKDAKAGTIEEGILKSDFSVASNCSCNNT